MKKLVIFILFCLFSIIRSGENSKLSLKRKRSESVSSVRSRSRSSSPDSRSSRSSSRSSSLRRESRQGEDAPENLVLENYTDKTLGLIVSDKDIRPTYMLLGEDWSHELKMRSMGINYILKPKGADWPNEHRDWPSLAILPENTKVIAIKTIQ